MSEYCKYCRAGTNDPCKEALSLDHIIIVKKKQEGDVVFSMQSLLENPKESTCLHPEELRAARKRLAERVTTRKENIPVSPCGKNFCLVAETGECTLFQYLIRNPLLITTDEEVNDCQQPEKLKPIVKARKKQ